MKSTDNLPIGAEDNPDAPFNEPLNVEHKRFVSLSISFYHTIDGNPDMSESDINLAVREWISSWQIPKQFDIDELVIMEE